MFIPEGVVRSSWLRLKDKTVILRKLVNGIVRKELLRSGDKSWKLTVSNVGANSKNLGHQGIPACVLYNMANIRLHLQTSPTPAKQNIN